MSEDKPEKTRKKTLRDECKSLILPVSEGWRGELNRHEVGDHFAAVQSDRGLAANGSGPPTAEEHGYDPTLLCSGPAERTFTHLREMWIQGRTPETPPATDLSTCRGTVLSPHQQLKTRADAHLSSRKSHCAALPGVPGQCLSITPLQRNITSEVRELTARSNRSDHKSQLGRVNKRVWVDTCVRVLGCRGRVLICVHLHTSSINAKINKDVRPQWTVRFLQWLSQNLSRLAKSNFYCQSHVWF